jgi:hypothetical protein
MTVMACTEHFEQGVFASFIYEIPGVETLFSIIFSLCQCVLHMLGGYLQVRRLIPGPGVQIRITTPSNPNRLQRQF